MKNPYHKSFSPITFILVFLGVQLDFWGRTLFMGRRKKARFMSRLLLVRTRPRRY